MKKWISVLLALALCLSMAACGGTGNEDHDYILHLLEEGNYDMAIYVIEGLRDNAGKILEEDTSVSSGIQENGDRIFEQIPGNTGTDWHFIMEFANDTGQTLTLESLLMIDYLDDQEGGTQIFEGEDLNILPLGQLVLQPGESVGWDDMRPLDYGFNRREYMHVFRNEQGEQIRFRFVFDMRDLMTENNMPTTQTPSGDWSFPIVLENTFDSAITLIAVELTNLQNRNSLDTYIFNDEESLAQIGLGGLVLEPGQSMNWFDGHPATSDWNGREYRFHFIDGNGQTQILSFLFENLHEQNQMADYSQDTGKDLKNLRHDVSYEVEVFPGVYWVPAAALGASRYSNKDIHEMLVASPEDKQTNISTLYEALQLYQVGNFTGSDDNVRIMENGINWEHHKPGYHAVRTNTGCCATDSNWLRYILDGDYEEVGYIATSQRDGGGHVYNYIFQDGWYYFIDLTHYHANGTVIDNAVENGDLNGYYATDYILGNIHKAASVQDYVDYVQQTFNDPPGLMFLYQAENVLAVEGISSASGIQITYEEANGQQLNVIFDDPKDSLTFGRAPSPTNLPDWSQLP